MNSDDPGGTAPHSMPRDVVVIQPEWVDDIHIGKVRYDACGVGDEERMLCAERRAQEYTDLLPLALPCLKRRKNVTCDH